MAVSLHGNNGLITTNGTAAAPSLAAPDNDTGLYFDTNLIHAATDGTERFRLDANGIFAIGTNKTVGNGSLFRVGTPLLAAGDGLAEGGIIVTPTSGTISTGQVLPIICAAGEQTNPGIARAGIAAVSTSGRSGMDLVFLTRFMADGTDLDVTADEKLRIKDNGKVGIGEDAPQQKLHLHEASSNGNFMVFTNSTTGATGNDGCLFGINSDEAGTIWNQENNYIRFGTNDTERLRITAGGNVQVYPNSSSAGVINLKRSTSTNQEATFYYGSSYLDIETREATGIRLKTNQQDRLIITSGGNVQIDNDSGKFELGADQDISFYHTGTHGFLENDTGTFYIKGDTISLNKANGNNVLWTNGSEMRIYPQDVGFGGAVPGGTPAGKNVFLAIGDSDTGIVQDGDGQLELWANAVEVANFNAIDGYTSTKLITTSNNMTMGGRLIHHGDTDTYMEYTDNQIDFVTGGSSRMYIQNSAVYVRSGTPLAFLSSSGATPNIKSGGTNNQHLLFTTGSGNPTRVQIDSSGNIGLCSYGAPETAVSIKLTGQAADGTDDSSDWGAAGIVNMYNTDGSTTGSEILLLGSCTSGVGQISSGLGFGRENGSNWGTYLSFKTHSTSTSNIDEILERIRINSNGSITQKAGSGDNQFYSQRTNAAGSNGNYFFHMKAQDNNGNNVGELGFHQDGAVDAARFIIKTRNNGGSSTEAVRWTNRGAHSGKAIMNRDCNGVSGGAWTTHGAWKVLIDLNGHPNDQLYMCDAAMQHLGAYTATFWVYKCNNGHYDIIHEESSLCDFRLNGSQIEIKQSSGVDQTNTTGYQKIFAVAGMAKPY